MSPLGGHPIEQVNFLPQRASRRLISTKLEGHRWGMRPLPVDRLPDFAKTAYPQQLLYDQVRTGEGDVPRS